MRHARAERRAMLVAMARAEREKPGATSAIAREQLDEQPVDEIEVLGTRRLAGTVAESPYDG
jgi:hypothetical protein